MTRAIKALNDLAAQGVQLEPNGDKLRVLAAERPDEPTYELIRQHKPELLKLLTDQTMLPRLPWQLERLIAAASSGLLPRGAVRLEDGLVPDLNQHVLAVAATYLTSDRSEAVRRLWAANRTWSGGSAPTPRTQGEVAGHSLGLPEPAGVAHAR